MQLCRQPSAPLCAALGLPRGCPRLGTALTSCSSSGAGDEEGKTQTRELIPTLRPGARAGPRPAAAPRPAPGPCLVPAPLPLTPPGVPMAGPCPSSSRRREPPAVALGSPWGQHPGDTGTGCVGHPQSARGAPWGLGAGGGFAPSPRGCGEAGGRRVPPAQDGDTGTPPALWAPSPTPGPRGPPRSAEEADGEQRRLVRGRRVSALPAAGPGCGPAARQGTVCAGALPGTDPATGSAPSPLPSTPRDGSGCGGLRC